MIYNLFVLNSQSVCMTRLESGPVPVICTPSDGTVHWTMVSEPNPM
jgi:hypothetical protein